MAPTALKFVGAGPPAHDGASAPYAPVGRYPSEWKRFEKLDSIASTCLPHIENALDCGRMCVKIAP